MLRQTALRAHPPPLALWSALQYPARSSLYVRATYKDEQVGMCTVTWVAGPGATAPSYHFLIIYSNMAPLVSTLSIALPTYRAYQPTVVGSYCKRSLRELSSVNAFHSNRISPRFLADALSSNEANKSAFRIYGLMLLL